MEVDPAAPPAGYRGKDSDKPSDEESCSVGLDAREPSGGLATSPRIAGGMEEPLTQMRYGITDVPPWWQCILLGFQAYLTMLGSTVLIPLLIVPVMGGSTKDLANVICTCFFASGINTLLQTLVGARLPIVQGGSFAYISPVLAITAQIQATIVFENDHERFMYTMRVLQGGIIGSALIALGLALFGIFLWLLRHLSPITIGVNIAILGLSLYGAGWPSMGKCIQLGLPVMTLIILFAFHMRKVTIFGFPLFGLFPVILGLGLTWLYAYIFTVAGVYDGSSETTQKQCTTDQANFDYIISASPWIRFPYPGQWGAPIFKGSCVLTMIAAVIPASLESIGDYYAAARLAGAPKPPSDVISRALAIESICCAVAGLLGTTSGSTAYAENVGAISITGVASRRVIQVGACQMIIIGLIGKVGAIFASIPQAMVAGMFVVMFSLITGVGFSNLHGVNLQSQRNIFILGFGLYCGLSIPDYFAKYTATNLHGPVNTGNTEVNNILNSIFATPAAVALIATMLLDKTIPMTPSERSQEEWQRQSDDGAWWEDATLERLYGWPRGLTPKWRRLVDPYRHAASSALNKCCTTVSNGVPKLFCGCGRRKGGSSTSAGMPTSAEPSPFQVQVSRQE